MIIKLIILDTMGQCQPRNTMTIDQLKQIHDKYMLSYMPNTIFENMNDIRIEFHKGKAYKFCIHGKQITIKKYQQRDRFNKEIYRLYVNDWKCLDITDEIGYCDHELIFSIFKIYNYIDWFDFIYTLQTILTIIEISNRNYSNIFDEIIRYYYSMEISEIDQSLDLKSYNEYLQYVTIQKIVGSSYYISRLQFRHD